MSAPLPVISEAYERFVRPPDDPYRVSNDPLKETVLQIANNAEVIALQVLGNVPITTGSGTSMSPDAIYSYQGSFTSGASRGYGVWTENETSAVVAAMLKERIRAFSLLIEREEATLVTVSPSATNAYSATLYCAVTGSITTRRPIEERYTWVKRLYELVRRDQTASALRVVYAAVEDLMRANELRALNEVLGEVEVHRLNPQTMTGLLRVAGRAKRALPMWKALLDRVSAELAQSRTKDVDKLLVGLWG